MNNNLIDLRRGKINLRTPYCLNRGELVEELTRKNGKKKKRLLIASKASRVFQNRLKGVFAYDANHSMWYQYTGIGWESLEYSREFEVHIIRMLYYGAADIGFTSKYMRDMLNILTRGNMLPLPSDFKNIPA